MALEKYVRNGGYFIAVCNACGDRVGPIEFGPNADATRLEQMVREVLLRQGWEWDGNRMECPPCLAAKRRAASA